MKLNYRKIGSGHPLVILHGLYGSGDNWLSIGKSFSSFCEVIMLDQRNHGKSPHHEVHNYEVLMSDLKEFLDHQGITKAMILGHSMGGKVAMRFAMEFPGMVTRMLVVDISPASYLDDGDNRHLGVHEKIIGAMQKVDLDNSVGLSGVQSQLVDLLQDERLVRFLLKNLRKETGEGYTWRLNLPVLRNSLRALSDGLDIERLREMKISSFPILFIRGEESRYIGEEDRVLIKELFPLSQMVTLKNTGHWLHAEQPDRFARIVKRFILS